MINLNKKDELDLKAEEIINSFIEECENIINNYKGVK